MQLINNSLMKILAIIPARYHSTRLPGKVMRIIEGKTLIQRVYEQVSKCKFFDQIIVAVDHELVFEHVAAFGGHAIMTSENLPSIPSQHSTPLGNFENGALQFTPIFPRHPTARKLFVLYRTAHLGRQRAQYLQR